MRVTARCAPGSCRCWAAAALRAVGSGNARGRGTASGGDPRPCGADGSRSTCARMAGGWRNGGKAKVGASPASRLPIAGRRVAFNGWGRGALARRNPHPRRLMSCGDGRRSPGCGGRCWAPGVARRAGTRSGSRAGRSRSRWLSSHRLALPRLLPPGRPRLGGRLTAARDARRISHARPGRDPYRPTRPGGRVRLR